jgi:hypothetical protein
MSMINPTDGKVIIRSQGSALDSDIRQSLEAAARTLLKIQGLEDLDVSTITTKRHVKAGFAKCVLTHTLEQEAPFNETYIENIWHLYCTPSTQISSTQFYAFSLSSPDTDLAFKRSYAKSLRKGVGIFLLALHSRRAITLPMTFEWPLGLDLSEFPKEADNVFSELLSFIRLLDRKSDDLPHQAFASVGTSQQRRE